MPGENTSNLAWRHARTIIQLPEPPDPFTFAEVEMTRSQLKLFKKNNLIEKYNETSSTPHEWVVDEDVFRRASHHVENSDSFACCGARGVTNDDGQLRCIECDAPVSSEEFRRVM